LLDGDNPGYDKGRSKAALSCDGQSRLTWAKSVVIDDDLAAVMIDVAIMVALLDDDRVAIAVVVAFANDLAFANDIAVTMAVANGHADRTHAHTDLFCTCRQRGSDERSSRDNS
jgi:hypothetical protein